MAVRTNWKGIDKTDFTSVDLGPMIWNCVGKRLERRQTDATDEQQKDQKRMPWNLPAFSALRLCHRYWFSTWWIFKNFKVLRIRAYVAFVAHWNSWGKSWNKTWAIWLLDLFRCTSVEHSLSPCLFDWSEKCFGWSSKIIFIVLPPSDRWFFPSGNQMIHQSIYFFIWLLWQRNEKSNSDETDYTMRGWIEMRKDLSCHPWHSCPMLV